MDVFLIAVEYTVKAIRALEEVAEDRDVLESFRSRMRTYPSLVLQSGLRPALAFYLSKTSLDVVNYFLEKIGSKPLGDAGETLRDRGKEKLAYGAASALLLRALSHYHEDIAAACIPLSLDNVARCFKLMAEKEPAVERFAIVFLTEAKKMTEALVRESAE